MSARRLLKVLIGIVAASAGLLLALQQALPALVSAPAHLSTPLWILVAPLVGGAAATLISLRTHSAVARGDRAESALGDLSTWLTLAFAGGALAAVLIGSAISHAELSRARPLATPAGAVALTIAMSLVLRTLVHPTLVAETVALAVARPYKPGESSERLSAKRRGTVGLRSALTVLALLTGALTACLSAIHVYSRTLAREERRAAEHLTLVTRACQLQLAQLDPRQYAGWAARFPASRRAAPLVVGVDSRALAAAPTAGRSRDLVERVSPRRCRVARREVRCAEGALSGGRRVVVVQDRNAARDAIRSGPTLALVGLATLLLAGLVGWRVGSEASSDIASLAAQVRAMWRREDLDLHKPVVVTSIDAVGELTAAVGRLRHRLEHELAAEEEAVRRTREAEAQKTQFIADVSHELRTPLNTLCGYSQLLLAGIEGDLTEAQTDDVSVIESAGKQLLGLVNDVLDMSVIDSGRLVLNVMRFDAAELCRALVAEKTAIIRRNSRPIRLVADLDPDELVVDSDPRRLRQVLQNLLSNALKFTDEGEVTLSLRLDSDSGDVVLTVADTGIGIAREELERVFEQYRQAGAARRRQQGSGLGLAICRRLTGALGGAISAESETGAGSRFCVRIPRSIATSKTGTTAVVVAPPSPDKDDDAPAAGPDEATTS